MANFQNIKLQLLEVIVLSRELFLEILPYLLAGAVLSSFLKRSSWLDYIRKVCFKHPVSANISVSILGIVSPLCTYGTIPVVLQLYRAGVPLPPLITFLSVSSLMNPQLFFITWAGINLEMALVQTAAVFVFGNFIGAVLFRLPAEFIINNNLKSDNNEQIPCKTKPNRAQDFLSSTWSQLQFAGFYVIIGIFLGSLVQVYVPPGIVDELFSPDEWYSVPLAALFGIPLYTCGGGAVPLVRSLMLNGMGDGSALAFFLAGSATRITPLMAFAAVVRPFYLLIYIVFVVIYSLGAGVLYN